jgi:hypothetical protein
MKTKILISILLAFTGMSVNAQWQQTTCPYSGSTRCMTISGSNIFAGGDDGIFLSSNDGNSWTAVNSGFTNPYAGALAVSGSNIFACGNDGVYLSSNNGSNWTKVDTLNAYDIAISGSNIFAGSTSYGVYLSTNNGSSWTAVSTGLTNLHVEALAISGSNIFAGTAGGGVFLSSNNGGLWTAVNTGLPTNTTVNHNSMAISGSNIFIGTKTGVYLSTNNGGNWAIRNTGIPSSCWITALAINGSCIFAGTDIYDGIYYSTNNGNSWTAVNNGLTDGVNSLAINSGYIFAGTNSNGVWMLPLSEVGIEEKNNNESNIEVYPNPATNKLTIKSLQKSALEILNIQGQTILKQYLQQGKTDIDISGLSNGVYIFILHNEKENYVNRIVIQN